ncbi:MAG TPA: dihydrolipoamide acetyltransferase family protein [Streptosporangiaceae bacterium]|nr:dihydrolipoamide acetyltransferase family protein [Streptosporangiaceae bacterium]
MPDFLLPDLGEGLEEAEVTAWHVQVGDQVAVDQIVAEVETAKAAVEVPIPFAGTVTALHAEPGTTVPVGAPLISVAAAAPGGGRPGPQPAPAPDDGRPEPRAADEASGNVLVGYGTRPSPRRARGPRRPAVSGTRTPARADAIAAAAAASPPSLAVAPARTPGGPVPVISPIVRKLARQAGLDLARIAGTGPQGLVLRRDVNQAIAAGDQSSAEIRIPIRGTRKAAAEKLTRSRREIPEATVWVDADAAGLLAARTALNAQAPRAPVSLLAVAARFALAGLRRYPELNAHIEADEIVIPAHVHLGFAAQTERGLVVPVVRNAHLMPARELAAALGRQTAAARAGRLTPADLTGGTFTVNNYGVFGVDGSAAIINHPEVAILGLGRIIDRPWVVDGQLAVRKVTELTLAFDHRVCDGATAGGFLRYVADRVESPALALETVGL